MSDEKWTGYSWDRLVTPVADMVTVPVYEKLCISGVENRRGALAVLGRAGVIFTINHTSFLDQGLVLEDIWGAWPDIAKHVRVGWPVNEGLVGIGEKKYPLVANATRDASRRRGLELYPIDTSGDTTRGFKEMFQGFEAVMEANGLWIVAGEGTRSRSGALLEAMPGLGKMIDGADYVVPLSLNNVDLAMNPNDGILRAIFNVNTNVDAEMRYGALLRVEVLRQIVDEDYPNLKQRKNRRLRHKLLADVQMLRHALVLPKERWGWYSSHVELYLQTTGGCFEEQLEDLVGVCATMLCRDSSC